MVPLFKPTVPQVPREQQQVRSPKPSALTASAVKPLQPVRAALLVMLVNGSPVAQPLAPTAPLTPSVLKVEMDLHNKPPKPTVLPVLKEQLLPLPKLVSAQLALPVNIELKLVHLAQGLIVLLTTIVPQELVKLY